MTVHWTVTHADAAPAHSVLTAELTGPYGDVNALKSAYGHLGASTFTAAALRPAPGDKPVSVIAIASTAAPGYYSLTTSVRYGDGGTASGGGIVEIRG